MKRIVFCILAALFIISAMLISMAFLMSGKQLRPFAESAVSIAIGKETRIGALRLDKGWTLGIEADDITIANDGEQISEPALSLHRFAIGFRILSLFEDNLDIPMIRAENGTVRVVRSADGELNWLSPNEDSASTPDDRDEIPSIGDIALSGITLDYRDVASGRTDRLTLQEVEGRLAGEDNVSISGKGEFNGSPTGFSVEGGPFGNLVDPDNLYDIRLAVDGPTRLRIEGELSTTSLGETKLTSVELSGDDFADLSKPFGIPFPSTPPYDIKGAILFADGAITLEDFSGRIGDSDASGTLRLDLDSEVPALSGTIISRKLDFEDLAGLLGADPDAVKNDAETSSGGEAADSSIIPDDDIPVGLFRAARIDVRLQAASVIAPKLKIENIDARFRLADDRLLVKPLKAGIADGSLTGEVAVNVRNDLPSADAELLLDGLALKRFFEDTDFVQQMGGRLSGRIYLIGTGRNLAEILGEATGGGHLVLRKGMISGLVVEAAGLDIVESLGLVVGGDVQIPMNCVAAAVTANHGVLTIDRGAISTDDSLLVTRGEVDLKKQMMDIQVEAREKDFSLIDLTAPISIAGPLADPDISIGGIDPFPFFSMPDEDAQANCDYLIREARSHAPGRPVN
jgi:uncharacterized protein involved in outer membrane biogenesis